MGDPDLLAQAARLEGDELDRFLGRFVNLTAHEEGPLPCLCKRCFDPARVTVEEGEAKYRRGYTIEKGRVLYYWMPEEIAGDALKISRQVRETLKERLRQSARKRKVARW